MPPARLPLFVRWIAAAMGAVVLLWASWLSYIYLASEAVIERRYTLPSSLVYVSKDAGALARGKHWITISGCFGCHGNDLQGRVLRDNHYLTLNSGNLPALTPLYSDGDFERAIRHGLTPDAQPMWLMPSSTYAYMRDQDLEDIIAYIRALPPKGAPTPRPMFDWNARKAIVQGLLVPASPKADEILQPADEGPRYDGGRYLSSLACAQCHGGDLTGSGYAPDLNIAGRYTRAQFFRLLYTGQSIHGWLPNMSRLAKTRFHHLHDYEVNALYEYLIARKTLPPWTKEQRAAFDLAKKPKN